MPANNLLQNGVDISGGRLPLLSFVIMARNDDYMGNAQWRLETTLDFLGRSLSALGRLADAEVVIVDWQSELPLHSALSLSQEVTAITRFVMVPQSLSRSLTFECEFPRPVILNAGIRRARGEYIVQTLGDVLWTREALERVFAIAEGKGGTVEAEKETLYVIGRKEIPYDLVATSPKTTEVETFIRDNNKAIVDVPPLPYLLVPGDSLMMHRHLWLASRGFDERLQHWGWSDCDIILRLQLSHRVVSKREDPALNVYHLNHIGPQDVRAVETRDENPWLFNDVTVNDADWGLGSFTFPEHPGHAAVPLEAVPPVFLHNYRVLHALNLLRFVVRDFSLTNARFALNCLFLILEQSPPGSVGKMIHTFLRLLKPRGASQR
jgi:glycosyltransferase involved in cell wall biosynthesis